MVGECEHNWVPVWSGEYDTLYRCVFCGEEHLEQADDPDSWLRVKNEG